MNRILLFFLFGILFTIHFENTKAQDTLSRFSLELDVRLVPVIRSFYDDYDFFNIKIKQRDSDYLITRTHNNFRTSYSVRLNYRSKNEKVLIGMAARYSRSQSYKGSFTTPDSGYLLAENMVADYIGSNIRILSTPIEEVMHGITLGGGVLLGRSQNVLATNDYTELPYELPSKKREYLTDDVHEIDLGYKIRVYDLYLNYTFQYFFKVGKQITLFAGFEVPLTRFFIFNNKGRFGLSFNDESFFTQFESFSIKAGEQETGNKNFAYSMKKTNSLSLNLGLRYNLN